MSDPHPPAGHPDPGHPAPAHGDTAHAHAAGHHHEGHISDKTFMKVFGALLVFTAISFTVNQLVGAGSPVVNFILILGVAIAKAFLVVTFFMHLKIDWKKIFVFVAPTMILAPIIIIVLWPDIVLAWTRFTPQ
jgi:caa(3)-type oxidase subunit IV